MIEIGLCSDDNYAMATGICITSIFESNKSNKIRVHILTNGFSDETTQRFEQTAKNYNQIIKIHNIDTSKFNDLHVLKASHVTSMAYARLRFPKVLDNSIDKLIYLDGDIVVIGDLLELWNLNIDNYACLAVPDLIADDIYTHNRIGMYDNAYINSGVLVMNLGKWRAENLSEKCFENIKGYPPNNPFHDQDAINAVLSKYIGLIHFKWNFMVTVLFNERCKILMHKDRFAALDEAQKDPIIIHYTAPIKPWHKEFKHPIISHFLEAKNKSLWANCKTTRKYKGIRRILRHITVDNIKKLRDALNL